MNWQEAISLKTVIRLSIFVVGVCCGFCCYTYVAKLVIPKSKVKCVVTTDSGTEIGFSGSFPGIDSIDASDIRIPFFQNGHKVAELYAKALTKKRGSWAVLSDVRIDLYSESGELNMQLFGDKCSVDLKPQNSVNPLQAFTLWGNVKGKTMKPVNDLIEKDQGHGKQNKEE